jgi:hypothetical protein
MMAASGPAEARSFTVVLGRPNYGSLDWEPFRVENRRSGETMVLERLDSNPELRKMLDLFKWKQWKQWKQGLKMAKAWLLHRQPIAGPLPPLDWRPFFGGDRGTALRINNMKSPRTLHQITHF